MKKLALPLFLLPFAASAQDTCGLKRETDPFTHVQKITTGFIPFTSNGIPLMISVDATPTEVDFFLWIKSDGACFDNQSTLQVNFEGDRLKANFRNTGSMNCEGAFHFTFRNGPATPGQLARLGDKRVSGFKIIGSDKKPIDITFTEEQKQKFQRMASCVTRESKTLLPK